MVLYSQFIKPLFFAHFQILYYFIGCHSHILRLRETLKK